MYCPPACGNIAASSPYESAADTVSSPVKTQVSSKPPGEPVCREMSAATMNIPEPIIDPTTIIVPSNNPIARTKPGSFLVVLWGSGWLVSAIRKVPQTAARVFRGFKCPDVLPRMLPWIGRAQNPTNYSNRVGARFDNRCRTLQRDSADGDNGLIRKRTHFAQEIQADNGIRIGLARCTENRSNGNVIRRTRRRTLKLIEIMRRNAD